MRPVWGRPDRDKDAQFSAFVTASYPSLCRTAYLVLGDHHAAEDVVQAALVGLYRRWSKVEHADGPGPYARRAVVNAAISELRRPHRRHEAARETLPEDPDPGLDPASRLRDKAVLAALRDLPPGQRAVVVLRYVEDVDVATTAVTLGISEGTVKSQSAKALSTLRGRLTPAHHPAPDAEPAGKATP